MLLGVTRVRALPPLVLVAGEHIQVFHDVLAGVSIVEGGPRGVVVWPSRGEAEDGGRPPGGLPPAGAVVVRGEPRELLGGAFAVSGVIALGGEFGAGEAKGGVGGAR